MKKGNVKVLKDEIMDGIVLWSCLTNELLFKSPLKSDTSHHKVKLYLQ